ncbi:MAG TPA: hypothetical protein VGB24_00905 [Longimicrobium sp.]|jgi:hypothetical protein|uniref:hypothetical protein n=1 Tax=Longimicrobium sp. TaxID=2029185 RepID=UPI002ED90516
MAKQKVTLHPDFADAAFDPGARQLHISRNGVGWELRSDEGDVLSSHPCVDDAIDAALELSKAEFREILVQGSAGRQFVSAVDQDPRWLATVETFRGTRLWRGEEGSA